jgi:hypothetical protein
MLKLFISMLVDVAQDSGITFSLQLVELALDLKITLIQLPKLKIDL